MYAGKDAFRGPIHCLTTTVRERGFAGLYRGGSAWVLFAGPRSAVRFGTFEALSTTARRRDWAASAGQSAVDTANGFAAGIVEAALCQTPNQVIAIKMMHDASPRGPKQYTGFVHAVSSMYAADGLAGFFQGLAPAVAKGAVTNSIRFVGYHRIRRYMQGEAGEGGTPAPLAPWQTMLAGGLAGAVSAVASQPIDTVKANMMGLEASRFKSSFGCAADLVRAGGVGALFNGVGPRVVRVFIEVGLQFTLFESVGRLLDKHL
jgi:solute carrier family 25 citrate transporter 1